MSDEFALAIGAVVEEMRFRHHYAGHLLPHESEIIADLLIAHAKDKRREIERLRFAFPDVFPEAVPDER